MPTLKELSQQRLERLESVPETFTTAVTRAEQEIWRRVMAQIGTLQTDKEGKIIANEANLARASIIIDNIALVLSEGEYIKALTVFASEFNTQAGINLNIYSELFNESVADKQLYQDILLRSQTQAVELLSEDAIRVELLTPLRQNLEGSIVGTTTIPSAIEGLRVDILGNDQVEGRLLRYTKQTARTVFAVADRSHSQIIADDLGIVWFRYQGMKVKLSRPFCIARKNKVFHKDEIAKWGSPTFSGVGTTKAGDWAGRIPSTNEGNIFVFLGGFQCVDNLTPMLQSQVSEKVIERVKAKGIIVDA